MLKVQWIAPILVILIVGATINGDAQSTSWGWWKRCGPAKVLNKSEEGKEEWRHVKICMTSYQRTGKQDFAAGVWRIDGEERQRFFVTIPPRMQVRSGVRVFVLPKSIWDKKQGKIERSAETEVKVLRFKKELKLGKTTCHRAMGCWAETEATPTLISDLQTYPGLEILGRNSDGNPVEVSIPLEDFARAFASPPESRPHRKSFLCAGAEWLGCSMKPIPEWGR